MYEDNKLAHVLATIEYMLDRLQPNHLFTLIQFSDEARLIASRLSMTDCNKAIIRERLHAMRASGNTNISDAVFMALDVLLKGIYRSDTAPTTAAASASSAEASGEGTAPLGSAAPPPISQQSFVLLFTDGLINRGMSPNAILDSLRDRKESLNNITFHCFGYGRDHCSTLLQSMAFTTSGGLYYFIDEPKSIASTFGECLAGMLSIVASNVVVRIQAFDGCRVVRCATKLPSHTRQDLKDIDIRVGYLYVQEQKNLLWKLSIRNMPQPMMQPLIRITVSYTCCLTGQLVSNSESFSLTRISPSASTHCKMPFEVCVVRIVGHLISCCFADVYPPPPLCLSPSLCLSLLSLAREASQSIPNCLYSRICYCIRSSWSILRCRASGSRRNGIYCKLYLCILSILCRSYE
jgi:hypothetical protein